MMYRLIVMTGPQTGQRITIEKEPMTMGSGDDCQIRMQDEEVARRHAVIEHNGKGLFIRDLGSMNRILVNSHEIREGKLKHGDMIELGRTRYLVQASVRAEVDGDAPVEEAPKPRRTPAWMIMLRLLLVLVIIALGIFWKTRRAQPDAISPVLDAQYPLLNNIDPNAVALPADRIPAPVVTPLSPAAAPDPALPVPMPLPPARTETVVDTAPADMAEQLRNLTAAVSNLSSTAAAPVIIVSNMPPEGAAPKVSRVVQDDRPKQRPGVDVTKDSQRVKIVSVEPSKFQRNDELDEQRVVNIVLGTENANEGVESADVLVEVSFFDKDAKGDAVVPTRATVPTAPLKVEGTWRGGEQKQVIATYSVPKGLRAPGALARNESYYGFVVRVYYQGRLQDTTAMPSLLGGYATGHSGRVK